MDFLICRNLPLAQTCDRKAKAKHYPLLLRITICKTCEVLFLTRFKPINAFYRVFWHKCLFNWLLADIPPINGSKCSLVILVTYYLFPMAKLFNSTSLKKYVEIIQVVGLRLSRLFLHQVILIC